MDGGPVYLTLDSKKDKNDNTNSFFDFKHISYEDIFHINIDLIMNELDYYENMLMKMKTKKNLDL